MRRDYPVLADALQQAASAQLRNMASLGGNVLQRTRCNYFRDPSWDACNKRQPGSGCAAIPGVNRRLAVLGVSEHCIANYPGDFAIALVALGAEAELLGAGDTTRTMPVEALHRSPGDTPHLETNLAPGELITGFRVPAGTWTRRSLYLKVRDRTSFDFALASAAVALELEADGTVATVRIGLGGLVARPWRAHEAEAVLTGRRLDELAAGQAAEAAFAERRHAWRERLQARARPPDPGSRLARGRVDGAAGWTVSSRASARRRSASTAGPRSPAARTYPSDEPIANAAWAFLVTSAIARGRIAGFELEEARALPGVLDILTHENVGSEAGTPEQASGGETTTTMENDHVWHDGQIIAVVVADTFEVARDAAFRVRVRYEEETPSATFGSPGVEDGIPHQGRAPGLRGRRCARARSRAAPVQDRRRIRHADAAPQSDRAVHHHLRVERPAADHLGAEPVRLWPARDRREAARDRARRRARDLEIRGRRVRIEGRRDVAHRVDRHRRAAAGPAGQARRHPRPGLHDRAPIEPRPGTASNSARSGTAGWYRFRHEGWEVTSRPSYYNVSGTETTARLYACPNILTRVNIVCEGCVLNSNSQRSRLEREPSIVPKAASATWR